MVLHRIQGKLKDGKLEIEIPDDLREGEYSVLVEVNQPVDTPDDDEVRIQFQPKPAEQIQTGGWEHVDIQDSVEWVSEQRRKRREQRE